MALWLVRAGKQGQHEEKFLSEERIYLCWRELSTNLSTIGTRKQLTELLSETYPNAKLGKIRQNSGQIWAFSKKMNPGDWVVLPSKSSPSVHIGEITTEYHHVPSGPDPYYHWRGVKWIEKDIPRTSFDQDILYSLGAFLTICEIKRNDAEKRVRAMAKNTWKAPVISKIIGPAGDDPDEADTDDLIETPDLEQLAIDQLTRHIIAKFKGHGLARLVGKILEAQGYTVHQPPEGPDKGIDLLAAPGALGFGEPRICVQVKSQETPIDRPTLDQLLGTMSNVQADRGLLVCWGGFKSTVKKEEAQQFFRVRLWDSGDLIAQLLENYSKLDDDLKSEIPLKHMWALVMPDDE